MARPSVAPTATPSGGSGGAERLDPLPPPGAPPPIFDMGGGSDKESLRAIVSAALADEKEAFTTELSEAVCSKAAKRVDLTFAKVAGALETKINNVDAKVDDLNTKFDTLQLEQRKFQSEMLAKVSELSKPRTNTSSSCHNYSTPPQAPPTSGVFSDGSGVGIVLGSGDFFRPPNPFILLANSMGNTLVAGEKFSVLFRKLAHEAGLSNIDNIRIAGPALGSRYEITFESAPAAKQFLASLYLGK